MKTEEFKRLMRESVRDELIILLPKLLNEYFNGSVNMQKSPPSIRPNVAAPAVSSVTKPRVQYTKNQALNDILNETVVKIPPEGTGIFINEDSTSITDTPNLPGNLESVFSRNYSAVLKKSQIISSNKSE